MYYHPLNYGVHDHENFPNVKLYGKVQNLPNSSGLEIIDLESLKTLKLVYRNLFSGYVDLTNFAQLSILTSEIDPRIFRSVFQRLIILQTSP